MEVSQRYRWWVSVPPASADKERGGVASPGMAAFAKSRVNFPSLLSATSQKENLSVWAARHVC